MLGSFKMVLRFIFTSIASLVSVGLGVASLVASSAKSRAIDVSEVAEMFEYGDARWFINDLAHLAWNHDHSRLAIETESMDVFDVILKGENDYNLVFYSGKLFLPTVPKSIGNIKLRISENVASMQLPFKMDAIKYVSQYRTDNEQQHLNSIEAKITDLEALIEVKKKFNATESAVAKLIIVDPGKLSFKLDEKVTEVLSSNPNVKWRLHKEIIKSLEKVENIVL